MSIFDQVLAVTESSIISPVVEATKPIQMNQDVFKKTSQFGFNHIELIDASASPSLDDWFDNAFGFEVVAVDEVWKHNGQTHTGDKILIRSDSGEKLSNASKRYRIVQPRQVVDFFRDVVETQGWTIHKMGYCDNGSKLFAFASTGQTTWDVTGRGDKMLNHVLITTSFDGSLATTIQPFMERFLCMNQLPLARSLFKPYKVRHSTDFDARKAKRQLGVYGEAFEAMQEDVIRLTSKRVTNQEAISAIYNVMADKDKPLEEQSTRRLNQINSVYAKYAGEGMGSREPGVHGTLWGVLNAITEYTDHEQGRTVNNRFKSSHFGAGMELKNDAFEILDLYAKEEKELELIKIPA